MILQVFFLIISMAILYYGAEKTLGASEKIGMAFGFSPLMIGLLIVGFGTSLPELFVSHLSCLKGESELALGNIVGSNIANLFLILGLSGVITPLFTFKKEIRAQFFLHLILTVILTILLYQDRIYLWGIILLLTFFSVYLYVIFRVMKEQKRVESKVLEEEKDEKLRFFDFFSLFLGLIFLYAGGEILVSSGSKLALMMGISTYVISAVFVAFGTSFPELVTAMIACRKKKDTELIIGSIIGSNIFNVSFVLCSISLYDFKIQKDFTIEVISLIVVAIFLLILSFLKKNLERKSGSIFILTYFAIVYFWMS